MPRKNSKRKAPSIDLGNRKICILHKDGFDGEFTPLSKAKDDQLAHLKKIRDLRLEQPLDSPFRMEDVCQKIPEDIQGDDMANTGYHRCCYQAFTKNLDRLKGASNTPLHRPISSRPQRKSSRDHLFPQTCIFCEKLETQPKGKTERCIKFAIFKDEKGGLIEPSWKQIETQSLEMGDHHLYSKVQGQDLFAREAHYHSSCRKAFHLKYLNLKRKSARADASITTKEEDPKAEAHEKAFNIVLDFIRENVIRHSRVIELTQLRQLYIEELEMCRYPNNEFRAEKLKVRIENHDISNFIRFAKVNPGDKGCITFNVIYSASISLNDAICNAYQLGLTDKIKDVADTLREAIKTAFHKSTPLPWPPSADEIASNSPGDVLPSQLVQFLNYVICGKDDDSCERTKRIILSIGQDICRAVTGGDWKLPKHILLCTTIRHLYRSKQLTTILNRLGHCESYDFSLELETAVAKALDDTSSFLTPQIVTGDANEVLHLEWDNMNKITTNVHGNNTVNSTAGIIIQEVKSAFHRPNSTERILPVYNRSLTRSLSVDDPETLAPVHLYNRVGPKFPEGSVYPSRVEKSIYKKHLKEFQTWVLTRVVGSNGEKQIVPGFGGFISATGTSPTRKSTIEYMTPIHEPFTEYSVIKELLKRSEEVTNEVGQEYVLNTFDLGGCMKALPIIWKSPDIYNKHIVIPGPFHTCMNYIGMVTGKKCKGSGYADILLEAGLVTSGCLKNVLKGKAYAKALFCLKTVSEAMERLLIESFLEEEEEQIAIPIALFNLTHACSRENLNQVLKDPSSLKILDKYVAYQENVRNGHLGKTAQFWISVMDRTSLLLMLQYSVKTNNFSLFHECNSEMADLFFAFDGPNYSRYLVWFHLFLTNIEQSHPGAKELLQKGGIAVARSLIPGALCAVDKTMEETFMKFAKSTGGFSGIFSMFGAYQRWCRSTSTRAQYYEKMLEMCGLINDPDCPRAGKHRDLEKAEIKKSEEAVQNTMSTICNFTNPFTLDDKDHLYSLASGAPMPHDVEVDVLNADEIGRHTKEKFIQERFVNGSSEDLFFEPIKRLNLKTMDATNKVIKLTASQGKVVQYRQQSDLAFMLLIKSQNLDVPLNIDELMKYSLTPVPYSLGTADGFFNKTNKAAMLQFLTEDDDEEVPYPTDKTLFIQDGNALFHSLTNLGPTFGAICLQLLDHMVAKIDFLFSTDSYHQDSIKSQERMRRGTSPRYIVDGASTRKPVDFKLFLANDDNKTQLCNLLLRVWGADTANERIKRCSRAIVVVEGKAYQLNSSGDSTSVQEIEELRSNQEETDTRVVLYLKHAESVGYQSAVVRTPDTDIFVILLHHASSIGLTIYLDTGVGKKRKIVNVSELALSKGQDYCSMVLGFYVFTGEDVTSAFKGKGKITPMKKLLKNPKYHTAFRCLGDEWTVNDDILQILEEFTCLMYGYPKEKSINNVRSIMLKKMVGGGEKMTTKSKIDLSRLPPCKDNLVPHIYRVNHRVAIFKRANIPIFWCPKPYDTKQGWVKSDDGFLEPVWSNGQILPPSLIDLIEDLEDEDEDDEEVEELDDDDFLDEDDE